MSSPLHTTEQVGGHTPTYELLFHGAMPGWVKVKGLRVRVIDECEGGGFALPEDAGQAIVGNGASSGWKAIETAPKHRAVVALFWHGPYRRIVVAAARGDGGWQDITEDSCVGWVPGQKKPGYWLCEAPEFPVSP